jgi:hypothetical protein
VAQSSSQASLFAEERFGELRPKTRNDGKFPVPGGNDGKFPVPGTSSRNEERNEREQTTELWGNVDYGTEERTMTEHQGRVGLLTWRKPPPPFRCRVGEEMDPPSTCSIGRPFTHCLGRPFTVLPPPSTCHAAAAVYT